MKSTELKALIREEIKKIMSEAGNFDTWDSGQGSGSQGSTQKGTPISPNSIKPGMNVIITRTWNGGQGSGSQGKETLNFPVKAVNADAIYLAVDAKYIQSQVMSKVNKLKLAKHGLEIPKYSISKATVI